MPGCLVLNRNPPSSDMMLQLAYYQEDSESSDLLSWMARVWTGNTGVDLDVLDDHPELIHQHLSEIPLIPPHVHDAQEHVKLDGIKSVPLFELDRKVLDEACMAVDLSRLTLVLLQAGRTQIVSRVVAGGEVSWTRQLLATQAHTYPGSRPETYLRCGPSRHKSRTNRVLQ